MRATSSRLYRPLVGVMAFGATLSMAIPFASILAFAVLLRRDRWLLIALLSSLGSAVGGLLLYLVFHHLGWNNFIALYPEVARSQSWVEATRWLSRYGISALLFISALPLPQTPALMFAGISRLPVGEVLLALLAGKLAKYSAYAWAVATFPERFARRYNDANGTGGSNRTSNARGTRPRSQHGN